MKLKYELAPVSEFSADVQRTQKLHVTDVPSSATLPCNKLVAASLGLSQVLFINNALIYRFT